MNLFETNEDQLQLDETKNYLTELVGEDKKFISPEDLAKGKYVSDHYIKTLEKRLDDMREEYKTVRDQNIASPKLQELIDKNDALLAQLASRGNTNISNEDNKAALNPDDVESLIAKRLQSHEETKREQENFNTVMGKLSEKFGKNYVEVLREQSSQLGLTDEDINLMARKNPNLFMKTFDLNVQKTDNNFQTPPRNEKRNDNFSPRNAEVRNWAYYEKMRKTEPMAWMDKRIAVQMEKDAQAQGVKFYET